MTLPLFVDECADRNELVNRYLHLTKTVMPTLAENSFRNWPVRNDHCFQRIVLDAICGDIWYKHLSRPACRSLSLEELKQAVLLCENIISGQADLTTLNQQSLAWRSKR
jgi:hypothetical protein